MKEQHVSHNDDALMLDETRVARLEDAVAIASAKMSCVRELDAAINSGHVPDTPPPTASPDLIIELISPINTTWRYPAFAQMLRRVSFSHCFLGSEQINFDADNDDVAQGHWVSWHPLTYDGAAWILAGRYRDTFTRQNSQWRLTSIEFTPEICTRWDEGWGTNRIAQELRSHVPD